MVSWAQVLSTKVRQWKMTAWTCNPSTVGVGGRDVRISGTCWLQLSSMFRERTLCQGDEAERIQQNIQCLLLAVSHSHSHSYPYIYVCMFTNIIYTPHTKIFSKPLQVSRASWDVFNMMQWKWIDTWNLKREKF